MAQRALDELRDLFARKIIEDELLWRELTSRYGEYFEGGMGAETIAQLIGRIDLDEEEIKLREAIDPTDGRRPLSAQRKQKAIKRLKIVSAFNRRDDDGRRANDPRAMILGRRSRSSRRTCARWCSSTVAVSRPRTSTTCTAGSSTETTG